MFLLYTGVLPKFICTVLLMTVVFLESLTALGLDHYPYPFESCTVDQESKRYICVQNSISGAVSHGKSFVKYGNCEIVRNQRPYWYSKPVGGDDPNDPRLKDPVFKTEYDWVVSQIRSVGCSCCHTPKAGVAPTGWDIDSKGVFTDQLSTFGLAVFAGENVDFERVSKFDPRENYGFAMTLTAVPTQDPERFKSFFDKIIQERGITQDEINQQRRFPGGVFDFLWEQPTVECAEGIGVMPDGTIQWGSESARYIWIMNEGSPNPLGPPSLDTPSGTIWKVRVVPSQRPVFSGQIYGERGIGTIQDVPRYSKPQPLELGKTYKLYVAKDIIKPNVNCTFVFGDI